MQAVAFPNLRSTSRREKSAEVHARWQDLRPPGRRPHLNRIVPKSLTYREHQGSPAHVSLLDDSRETLECSLRHQAMEFIDEIVDKRNPCSASKTDSRERVHQAQTEDDVRPEAI